MIANSKIDRDGKAITAPKPKASTLFVDSRDESWKTEPQQKKKELIV
jgi:hypothetical protein